MCCRVSSIDQGWDIYPPRPTEARRKVSVFLCDRRTSTDIKNNQGVADLDARQARARARAREQRHLRHHQGWDIYPPHPTEARRKFSVFLCNCRTSTDIKNNQGAANLDARQARARARARARPRPRARARVWSGKNRGEAKHVSVSDTATCFLCLHRFFLSATLTDYSS